MFPTQDWVGPWMATGLTSTWCPQLLTQTCATFDCEVHLEIFWRSSSVDPETPVYTHKILTKAPPGPRDPGGSYPGLGFLCHMGRYYRFFLREFSSKMIQWRIIWKTLCLYYLLMDFLLLIFQGKFSVQTVRNGLQSRTSGNTYDDVSVNAEWWRMKAAPNHQSKLLTF